MVARHGHPRRVSILTFAPKHYSMNVEHFKSESPAVGRARMGLDTHLSNPSNKAFPSRIHLRPKYHNLGNFIHHRFPNGPNLN